MKPVTNVPSLRRVEFVTAAWTSERSGLWNCCICYVLHGLERLRSDETQLWYLLVRICCLIWTVQYVPLVCILMWTFRSNSMRIDHSEIHNRLDIMCISMFINVHLGPIPWELITLKSANSSIKCALVCYVLLALISWELITLKSVNKNICADHPYYQCDFRGFFFTFYTYIPVIEMQKFYKF